jgi:hypothetical protein
MEHHRQMRTQSAVSSAATCVLPRMLASEMSVADLANRLPDIPTLRRWLQSLAVLDATVCKRPDLRYFAFDATWSETEQIASMSNGSGDEYAIVFGPVGAYVRGFDHESEMSPWARTPMAIAPGLIDEMPLAFREYIE